MFGAYPNAAWWLALLAAPVRLHQPAHSSASVIELVRRVRLSTPKRVGLEPRHLIVTSIASPAHATRVQPISCTALATLASSMTDEDVSIAPQKVSAYPTRESNSAASRRSRDALRMSGAGESNPNGETFCGATSACAGPYPRMARWGARIPEIVPGVGRGATSRALAANA